MESYINISKIKKQNNDQYEFFLNLLDGKDYNEFFDKNLNLPKLPLIGCNLNENPQLLGKILGLVCFEIEICQGENKDEIKSKYSDFFLPSNIADYLNVDEVIEIDNNTNDKDTNLFFMPKNKLNFYLIISEIPKYNSENDDNNFIDNSNNIDDDVNNNNKINIIDDDNEDKNKQKYLLCNIIPQLYYSKDILVDLKEIGNLNFLKQITLFSLNNEQYQDIYTEKDKSYIEINNLRGENSNIKMKNNIIRFSPNNLKFILDTKNALSQFYLMITSFDQDYHSVFYFITCNNTDSKNKMKNILNKSIDLNGVIEGLKIDFGESSDVVVTLEELFYSE